MHKHRDGSSRLSWGNHGVNSLVSCPKLFKHLLSKRYLIHRFATQEVEAPVRVSKTCSQPTAWKQDGPRFNRDLWPPTREGPHPHWGIHKCNMHRQRLSFLVNINIQVPAGIGQVLVTSTSICKFGYFGIMPSLGIYGEACITKLDSFMACVDMHSATKDPRFFNMRSVFKTRVITSFAVA